MGLLNTLFGPKADFKKLIEDGALIVDVRTRGEFQGGHVAKSTNIPLDEIDNHVESLKKKNKVIILCCASGMRSGSATSRLKREGIECYNGGSWMNVNRYA